MAETPGVGQGAGPSSPARRASLLRVLGLGFGLAVIVGNTVGAGILRTPGEVAARLPNEWLFFGAWAAGGLYALVGAWQIAELGTMLPRSGGQYVYARRALGPFAGFVVGWSDWVSTCGTTAVVSIVVGEYVGALAPALAGRAVAVALFVNFLFAALQWRGVVWGGRVQNVTSALKALAFLALVAACFALAPGGRSDPNAPALPTPAGFALVVASVAALQSVIYTYDGWTGVVYFSEEVRDPGRDIPRALFGGVLLVVAIYLLVNAALLYVLPLSRVAGEELAVGAAARVVFGAHGDTVIRALTVVSLLGGLNAYHLMATRVLFAMSRDRLFAGRAAEVNAGGTPAFALLVSAGVAALFILTGSFDEVVAVLAFFFVANYALSFLSLFVLRRREPDAPRPYRAFGYPATTALALAGSLAFLAAAVLADTRNSLRALALLALSYPVYLLSRRAARARP